MGQTPGIPEARVEPLSLHLWIQGIHVWSHSFSTEIHHVILETQKISDTSRKTVHVTVHVTPPSPMAQSKNW